MDEPTEGLDPNQKHEVRTLIKEMAANKAIIISTHILEEVDAVCTRAIIIASGSLMFEGTPAELEARSRLHNAVTLSLAHDSLVAQRELAKLENVEAVEIGTDSSGNTRLTVVPRHGANVISAINEFIATRGWTTNEFRVESGRLDEVFRTITTQASAQRARS
jgi:ABC-2 type transport system ATP-binding protein